MNPVSPTISFETLDINARVLFKDSYYIRNFAEHHLNLDNSAMFHALSITTPWATDQLRNYPRPNFQNESMSSCFPFSKTPLIQFLAHALEQGLRVGGKSMEVNHVIASCYRNKNDHLAFHSEINYNSPILMLSFGETRELHMRKNNDPTEVDVFLLKPGDLFVLGYQTNLEYQYSIVPVRRELYTERPSEDIHPCITLVFRDIRKPKEEGTKRRKVDPVE